MINFKKMPSNAAPIFDELFNDLFKTGVNCRQTGLSKHPAVNIQKLEDKYVLEIAAPGLEKADFNIEMEKDQLVISVEKEMKKEETAGDYTRKEFNFNNFKRSFYIPETIDLNAIDASYNAGILFINLPVKEEAVQKTRAIAVS